jgi:hypothetical protein
MTKKDVLFLLAPSILFVTVAAVSLVYATALSPSPREKQGTQRRIDRLVRDAQRGEFGPEPDKLVGMLSKSWRTSDDLQEVLGNGHAQFSELVGCGVLVGVMVQIYVIFRVKAAHKKPNL